MKKIWSDPELTSLEIAATAGGPVYNTTQDGPVWWDPTGGPDGEGAWQTPSGEAALSP